MSATTQPAISTNSVSEIIKTFLERRGKFQCILVVLLSLNSISVGINHTITAFHIYVPEFYCRDAPLETCNIIVNETECPSGYAFDEADDRSVAVEWSLVCDKILLAPLVNTIYFVGVTLGALICSTLCDVWGRKKLVLTCLYAQALMAVGQYISGSLLTFVIFRMLQGFFIQGLQTCSYTLMLEYCPSKYRTIAATFWEANWAIGLGILGAASYFIREWRLLTLVLTLPAIVSLTYSWMFPESITWLYTKGDKKEVMRLIHKIATFNESYDIIQQCNSMDMDEVNKSDELQRTAAAPEEKAKLSDIVRNPVLRKHLFSMIAIWYSVTLSYYGILYFLPKLAGQRHLNFLIGAAIELCAYILAYFILSGLGRRLPMVFYQYANGILLLIIGIITTIPGEGPIKVWCLIIITLIAKGLAVSSFCAMFIYCSELLPTVCRGLGLGLCGFSARCGSLLAPQLLALIHYMPAFIPLSAMAVLLLISATVTIFLPETLSSALPNTIAEADEMWRKQK